MSRINFAKLLNDTLPLENSATKLRINNIVGTVKLLGDGQSICLESIAAHYGGLVKFAPKKFAAAILRVKDSISTTTCLAFRSGKIVVVGALSENHSLCACQNYRRMIEQVEIIYANGGSLGPYNLINRTQFKDWRVTNIVADFDIGYRPDLKVLAELLADLSNWNPDLFPGLKLIVWIRPKSECVCVKKKKNKSCKCNARVLLFDTGKAVFTGCKSLSDINQIRFRIEELMSDEIFHDKDDEPTRKDRFESRREKIVKAAYVEFVGWTRPPTKKAAVQQQDPVVGIYNYVETAMKKKKRVIEDDPLQDELPLVKACKLKQYDNVKFIASFDDEQVLEALQYAQDHPGELTEEMIELIEMT